MKKKILTFKKNKYFHFLIFKEKSFQVVVFLLKDTIVGHFEKFPKFPYNNKKNFHGGFIPQSPLVYATVRSAVMLAPSAYLASAASTAVHTRSLLPDIEHPGTTSAVTTWSAISGHIYRSQWRSVGLAKGRATLSN